MSPAPIPIALDLSCIAESPITGIGYAALYQMRALMARNNGFDFRILAAGDTAGAANLRDLLPHASRSKILPRARLLKYNLWTRFSWPPIEWFCGDVAIAHNLCHQTPATRRAIKVVTIHDLSPFRFPETHTARMVEVQTTLLRQSAKKADALVAVSQNCKDEIVEVLKVPEDRIHVVRNGVDMTEFEGELDSRALDALKARLGIARDYFIQLGTIEPRKNIPRLIEAYKKLLSRRPDLPQLVIVGKAGWKSETSFDAMRELVASKHIVYCGYLPRADAVLLLRGARACVYPSLYEGFGLPVLEAMAARTPVVTSNISSLPEVAGDAALLVSPTDTEALAHAMSQIIEDAPAAATRTELGYQRAQSLSWNASADSLSNLYRQLANRRGIS